VIIGEWAIAIGNPFGLFSNNAHPTVTVGVISAVDRDFQYQEGKLYQDMIQTDASINPGNSGGPLLNSDGMVIGMNTMIFSESGGSIGLGFAIPANKIGEVVDLLKESGNIDRNYWIGISIQDVNSRIANALGLNFIKGVVVTDIDPNSPADKAGMHITDVIIKINGIEIGDKNDVQKGLNSKDFKVGDTIVFQIFREGQTKDLRLKLEPLPK
jgi:serine protease Do